MSTPDAVRAALAELVELSTDHGSPPGLGWNETNRWVALLDEARAALSVEPATVGCWVNGYSARMCERGTKGCNVVHVVQPAPIDQSVAGVSTLLNWGSQPAPLAAEKP